MHVGLASECYTHFTSPIRRYPDLIVHRLLKKELKKKTRDSDTIDATERLNKDAQHCSRQERVVEAAEREFIALKKVQFMKDKVGQEFVGFISGVKEFGFFVELSKFYIEGLVPMRTLEGDVYQFLPKRYVIEGRRHKREFRLGDKVTVQVAAVDMEKRQIDFHLVEE